MRWLNRLIQTARRSFWAAPTRCRRPSTRLGIEELETRINPTGSFAVTNILPVDGNNNPLPVVNIGEWVFIQVDFTTNNLPSNASYRVGITVNGLTLDSSTITWGAGSPGMNYWDLYWGTFIATPGINQVTATVDPDHSVAETSYAGNTMSSTFNAVSPAASGFMTYTVAQMRAAYGINSIPDFGAATPDGSGQTIALVEAGNEPTIISDLDGFDQAMSMTTAPSSPTLYQQYGAASTFVNVYNQSGANITANIANSGSNGVPAEDPTGHWEGEETLDVEWAHAIAPGAKIDIIEVNDDNNWPINLLNGDKLAASLPGVSAISNSWGLTEWSGETAYDSSIFVTPAGHTGVTFLTASNDNGANVYPSPPSNPAPSVGNDGYYPATSPNVVSVGGTQLTLNNDAYGSETAWSYPAPTTTVDNGSTSYSQTGTWTSQSGGFNNGGYWVASGGSSSSASWTLAITPTNTGWGTEVSATWTAAPGNATNATYTIYDGTQASGTILGTVTVNQAQSPAGVADGSSVFQELGVFFPTLDSNGDGTLTVVLNANSANGAVVADAIGAAQAWASTGGPTRFESEPSYQLPFQSTGLRTTPDVSFDASQNSGVDCYQNGGLGYGYFGTSLSSPCWAGLIAIANQGRVAAGGAPLNSPSNPIQTLQALYSLPAADFRAITTGYNGFSATAGYDDLTGRGTPIANLLIPNLASFGLTPPALAGLPVVNGNNAVINIVSATGNGTTATITTSAPHGFWIGELVKLTGASPGGPGGLAGTVTVTGVPSATTFQFASTYSGSESLSGATVTASLAGAQRSMVDSIVFNFTEPVTLSAAAFSISVIVDNTSTGDKVGVAPTLNVAAVPFTNEWVVTFTDPVNNSVIGNSIADGAYSITINPALVTSVVGQNLSAGETDTFYRLYGDMTGVQSVKNVDANAFNRAWGNFYYSANYNAALDYNDDGKYTNIDANAFNRAFNTRYNVATSI